jgi:CheY-like chemotaxis protein
MGYYLGGSFSGAKMDNFMGAINARIASLNLAPLREDYSKRQVKVRIGEDGPSRELTVVIVDDSAEELVKTARALAGWPNLKVVLYRQHLQEEVYRLAPEDKVTELSKTAQEILALNPQVILMDMGLRGFEGTELIGQLRKVAGQSEVIFVGNTGGNDDELRRVGAFANCDKGRNLQGVREAILSL